MKNIILLTCILISIQTFAQTSLTGKVTDAETGEPILFGTVTLYKDGSLLIGTDTNIDGFYNFPNINPGTYDVEVSYVGYATERLVGIVVYGGQANKADIRLGTGVVDLDEVVVVEYKVPLISQDMTTSGSTISMSRNNTSYSNSRSRRSKRKKLKRGKLAQKTMSSLTNSQLKKLPARKKVNTTKHTAPLKEQDQTSSGGTLTSEQLKKLPTRNIGAIATNAAGVSSGDEGDALYMRGGRDASTFYMVDGIRVQGSLIAEEKKEVQLTGTPASGTSDSPTTVKKPKAPNHQQIENPPGFMATPQKEIPLRKANPTSEEYSKIVENQFIKTVAESTSTFSIDVDKASYSMIRRFLKQDHSMPPPDAVRIEEMINYFNYDYQKPSGEEPFSLYSATAKCPWEKDDLLVHIGIKGKEIELEDAAPNNLVFLIDVSGSMNTNNKLELLKPAFEFLVERLRPQDRVAIVTYAGRSALVLPSTAGDQTQTITKAIKDLRSGGGTAGEQGIKLAYKIAKENFVEDGNNRVILATDGDFNVGLSHADDLEKLIEEKRKTGVYLTTLGFGSGNYKDDRMERLADKGNGNYSYIDNLTEAKKTFVTDLTGTLYTIAKDVKIQIDFDSTFVESYRLIGYENRLLANEDFHDDTKDAGELGAGHTVTALYQLKLKEATPEEILKLKLRYKLPKEDQSRYIESYTTGDAVDFKKAPENLRFAASVAGYGMLLRGSAFAGDLKYSTIKKMAEKAKGTDQFGLRKEFIELVDIVKKSERIASK